MHRGKREKRDAVESAKTWNAVCIQGIGPAPSSTSPYRVGDASCARRSISAATGVFIETSNLGLRKGQQVVLSFAINLGTITKLHRRTAVVAHVSRGGTGLMMESFAQASS